MSLLIHALDNQFAVATGSNVHSSPGKSTFDHPPDDATGLVIQSRPGDATPQIFSPGDIYSLSFSRHGTVTVAEATVIRSDFVSYDGDDGYAVVFEGADATGAVVQVVWSPEFDLDVWYQNNFDPAHHPGFYITDLLHGSTYQMCFEAATPILTPDGPRPAETLRSGDLVLTRDHGSQPVLWVAQLEVPGTGRGAPVRFDTGVLGNRAPLWLSRQHRVLLASPLAEQRHGSAEVLVPAAALLTGAAVRLDPRETIRYIHLLFDRHEIVTAAGAACESLLLARMADRLQPDPDLRDLAGIARDPCRPLLTLRQGEALWRDMIAAGSVAPALFGKPGRSRSLAYVFTPRRQGPRRNCHQAQGT